MNHSFLSTPPPTPPHCVGRGFHAAFLRQIHVGDLVIADGAVRDEGCTAAYIKPSYPAVANYEAKLALAWAAENQGFPFHIGITLSTDSIYCGQGRPLLDYIQEGHRDIPRYWTNARVMNFERETSIILTLCSLMGKRGAAVNAVVNNMETGVLAPGAGSKESILTVLEGITILSKWDGIKTQSGKRYWLPSYGN